MKLLDRLINGLPKRMKDIWWNRTAHMSKETFPIIKWENIGYLNCQVGLIVPMRQIDKETFAYYKVTKIHHQKASDWLYPSDSISCDMVFHSVRNTLGVGNLKLQEGVKFIEYTP